MRARRSTCGTAPTSCWGSARGWSSSGSAGARARGLKRSHVDIDPRQHALLGARPCGVADAAAATAALTGAVVRRARPADVARRGDAGDQGPDGSASAEIQPHAEYLRAIRDVLPRDGFFVEEICQAGFASYFALPVYEPRTFVSCGYQGTLGFGYADRAGREGRLPGPRGRVDQRRRRVRVRAAGADRPRRPTRIGVAAIVFDNSAYGNVLRDQQRLYEGREVASRLRNPDFAALAEVCGVRATRAHDARTRCATRSPGRSSATSRSSSSSRSTRRPRCRRGRCSCRAADEERARSRPGGRRDARDRGRRACRAAVHAVHGGGPGGLRVRDAARAAGPQRGGAGHGAIAGRAPRSVAAAGANARQHRRRARRVGDLALAAVGAAVRPAARPLPARARRPARRRRLAPVPALPGRRRALRARPRPARGLLHDRRQRRRPRVRA